VDSRSEPAWVAGSCCRLALVVVHEEQLCMVWG
jgi:hypothetical protein